MTESLIMEVVAQSKEFVLRAYDMEEGSKPRLLIDHCNPNETVAALRDILAAQTNLIYERVVPIRLAFDQLQDGVIALQMTADAIVLLAHGVCRPYALKKLPDGSVVEVDARLPRPIATMYLGWRGEWRLAPLNGIASSPLLADHGAINTFKGYDVGSGMWCEKVPDLGNLVPVNPTKEQAAASFLLIRETFKTFCFADAETVEDRLHGVPVVDTAKPPGKDESGFLVAFMTAVCRPSLHLAPGVLLRAAPMSGAGAGKGLLARCMCIVAFGHEPHAVTSGATSEELEKRIAAELMEGSPALFIDNLNNTAFKSDLLASVITERPARVRLLGKSQMVPLNASALVLLTGNGLTVSEDLARRFIAIELDPRTEDPEARPFASDIRAEVTAMRTVLLAAALTIWRWGRQATNLPAGSRLGSFETWGRWVRDPLLALGCEDPAQRVSEAKQRDSRRQVVSHWFTLWRERQGDEPVAASALHEDVRQAIDPQGRGRQYVASQLEKHTGTRIGGFVLERQAAVGKWGTATYVIKNSSNVDDGGHRGHRDEAKEPTPAGPSYAPYAPYAGGEHDGNNAVATSGDEQVAAVGPTAVRAALTPVGPQPWRMRI
ncbi:hypothetical protein [Tardiphaga sp. 839_C3_N1_4]|uniref:hypothetical protein n=1 Tax=Tardiphaga sp. 839_C3_N1_4 TaxID=3240761 RepID=UPI003F253ABC